jgi:hypothetical protein
MKGGNNMAAEEEKQGVSRRDFVKGLAAAELPVRSARWASIPTALAEATFSKSHQEYRYWRMQERKNHEHHQNELVR